MIYLANQLYSSDRFGIKNTEAGSTRPISAVAVVAGMATASPSPSGAIVVYVTVPDENTGKQIAAKLVEDHLVACVNMVPGVQSIYWWDNKVNYDSELMLIIKTRESLLGALTTQVKQLHPYDEPEVIAMPIIGGSDTYIAWLKDSTAQPKLQP
eukprot:jgi/Chrzof1/6076/Cz17g08020.t1